MRTHIIISAALVLLLATGCDQPAAETALTEITRTGALLGTALSMAPEQ